MTLILLIFLGALFAIGILSLLISLFKLKLWIYTKAGGERKLLRVGFMAESTDQEVPEVHLEGDAAGRAVGRIKIGRDGKGAYVELLTSDIDDDSSKPSYRTYGFVDQNGFIYKQPDPKKRPVIIGYTARPSNPNEPCVRGERAWRTLWIKSVLNVYSGLPEDMESETVSPTASVVFNAEAEPEVPEAPHESEMAELIEDSEVLELSEKPDDNDFDDTENDTTDDFDDDLDDLKGSDDLDDDEDETDDSKTSEKSEKPSVPTEVKPKDPKAPKSTKKPVGRVSYTSIRSTSNDGIPIEARGAAFSMLFNLYNKKDYREYYCSPAFGWKDTAFLAAFIYTILYACWYMVAMKVFGVRFIGFKIWLCIPFFAAYFPLWAIVRAIKIEFVERSNTVQPKIDLFNKVVGQKSYDIAIIVCCVVTLLFTGTYYRFNFLPLALVLIIATSINLGLKNSRRRWEVKNPLEPDDKDDMDEDEDNLKNPDGDIEKTYEWELDSSKEKDVKGQLALYFYGQYISELRAMNPFYNQRNDKSVRTRIEEMFKYLIEHKSLTARTRYIVSYVKRIAAQRQLDLEDTLQFALDFIQEPNIRFAMNRDSMAIHRFEDYIRYPDETLYDKEADANSKALLASMIFHYLGHDVVFLLSRVQHFGAIGIRVCPEWVKKNEIFGRPLDIATFEHNGHRYLFCEVTSDGFRIGGTIYGMSIDDFDERIELFLSGEADDNNTDSHTCIYNWQLDSAAGNRLEGAFTLEFDSDEMLALRNSNPFVELVTDSEDYGNKIRTMFAYLKRAPGAKDKVGQVAEYIRSTVNENKLSQLDMVQFALDFCQEPNIKYCIDENSVGIGFAKEYMRFPDEVLYDKEGDCDCKSSLTAALLSALGFKVIIMLSQKLQHAGIGVEYNPEWKGYIHAADIDTVLRVHNGTSYLYCETTGDGFKVGQIEKNQSIQDFETIVEI